MPTRWIDIGNGNKILVEVDDEELAVDLGKAQDMHGNRPISGKENPGKAGTLLSQLTSLANVLADTAPQLKPDEIELTGQIKFSGESGVPIFVKAKGETAFQIKLCWKNNKN